MEDQTTSAHTLIVGGTRGLGAVLARTLADKGQVVSVIGRKMSPTGRAGCSNIHHSLVDISRRGHLSRELANIIRRQGNLSHLVFVQRYRGGGDDWTGEIETSLTATKWMIEQLADNFDGSKENSIVLVSSIGGQFVLGEQPLSYHVGKAALNHMVHYYAVVLGPKGLRVNGVLPGTFVKEESKDFFLRNERLSQTYRSVTPLRRMGTAKDIVQVILFLCSPNASFVTGQNIVVDGGMSLQHHETLARRLAGLDPKSRRT